MLQDPPGVPPRDDALRQALSEAVAAQGPDYRPRTHHLADGGRPVFTNRLVFETSPYLLQHAHNPVDWRPWGDEAFEESRRTGKPVFLSVGYATCHWCHVMETESFEDRHVAHLLNDSFVPVKVDREERPDVDTIYMTAVQALTGQGGWPMSVWLDADRQAFFAGTYFPPEDRYGRPGFATLLTRIREFWDNDREALGRQAEQLSQAVRAALEVPPPADGRRPGAEAIQAAGDHFVRTHDRGWGGFGGAPKFPRSEVLRFLLRHHRRTGDADALAAVTGTLDAMAAGGIHDHLGGGFARYSTDAKWLVPHFEKMLYDNALLALAYTEAWQATGEDRFAAVVAGILDWADREMSHPEGGFYSAIDADSEGEEGRFYVWTPDEIDAVVGDEAGAAVRAYYGVTKAGNFEGRTVLHAFRPLSEVSAELGLSPEQLSERLTQARPRLLAARNRRERPQTDDKVLAGWNGLMISAFAVAGRVLDRPEWVVRAERAADFVGTALTVDGRLRRAWRAGKARHDATLEDHAFLAQAHLDLFEATGDGQRLAAAVNHMEQVEDRFRDPAGGWFSTASDAEKLLSRPKEVYDGAVPAGGSVAAMNALRLEALTGDRRWGESAEAALSAAAEILRRQPAIAPTLLCALDWVLDEPWEVVVVWAAGADPKPLLEAERRRFLPNAVRVVVGAGAAKTVEDQVPLLAQRRPPQGEARAWLCRRGVCLTPTGDPAEMAATLEEVRPLA